MNDIQFLIRQSRVPMRRLSSGGRQRIIVLLTLACLAFGAPRARAFEPMPDLMQRLLQVFPERDGWFVEEPLGTPPQTPDEARPFFETFRVIVPDCDAVELAVGRLLSATGTIPTHKVTRYDKKPDAPGMPGFRGVWCRTEDDSLIGFSILTPNQNRFLIWAKYEYYAAWGNDTIPPKARDKYARDVSQYFASLDAGVPDTEAPRAVRQDLPEWMDLFPPVPETQFAVRPRELRERWAEIRAWGLSGVVQFQPTAEAIDRFIERAPDALWPNREMPLIQHLYRQWLDLGNGPLSIRTLTANHVPGTEQESFFFAVDRYGRVRFADEDAGRPPAVGWSDDLGYTVRLYGRHAILFPGVPILAGGFCHGTIRDSRFFVEQVSADANAYFYSYMLGDKGYQDVASLTDTFVESLGHFFAALKQAGVRLDHVMIRKFWP